MKLTLSILFCGVLVVVAAEDFVYEFGAEDDHSSAINTASGNIGLLSYLTEVIIPVPASIVVNYVKVTVDAFSPPKVDYDSLYHRVTIRYSWLQITRSSYKIIAKGGPVMGESGLGASAPSTAAPQ